jgi:phage-related baseplate assembly protein
MDVSAKLQIKPGQRIVTVGMPGDVPPIAGECAAGPPEAADVVVAFVRSRAELATVAVPAIEAARRDKLAWIAYPKAGKLGTDLNRDLLSAALAGEGVQPVRQVAIDEVWSALRFRPA